MCRPVSSVKSKVPVKPAVRRSKSSMVTTPLRVSEAKSALRD